MHQDMASFPLISYPPSIQRLALDRLNFTCLYVANYSCR